MKIKLTAEKETLLSEALKNAGYPVAQPCGGNGKCGKCTVLLNGTPVRACCTCICGENEIELEALSGGNILGGGEDIIIPDVPETGLGAAVDLGTTTVAIRVFDLETGAVVAAYTDWNAQSPYGADVISRIDYINKNNALDELSGVIRRQMFSFVEPFKVKRIFLAGNTVMQHIFAGLSPSSIAVAPFTPVTLFENYSGELNGIPVTYSPCAAGYVGGDITAGLLASKLHNAEKPSLFIDIGTNGEMGIGNRDGFTVCAVASGPAFEGAEISCGMPGLEGAVNHVYSENGDIKYTVIGDALPKGICGSGLIDLIAVLLETEDIDISGRLDETYYLTENVYLTGADVRKLQLAKAAVRAGISVLMEESGLDFEDIEHLYISGGFGNYLNIENAAKIDMLPAGLAGKTVLLGNTSLKGASMALLSEKSRKELFEIQKKCRYTELSGSGHFSEEFIEHMMLGEEE